MDPVIVGQRVRMRRLALKLTQRALAAKAEVSANTIRSLERGTAGTRRPQYLRIVDALGITPDLLERSDDPIAADHPLLVGLNEDDLSLAQAYSRAPTRKRVCIERFLFEGPDPASGLLLLDRIEHLPLDRRKLLLDSLAAIERALAAEDESGRARKPPRA